MLSNTRPTFYRRNNQVLHPNYWFERHCPGKAARKDGPD